MTDPRSLSALLRIPDEADAIQVRQETQATDTRESLIQAAQQLGTAHHPATLAQAVDAYMESSSMVAPLAKIGPDQGFAFGWARPGSEQERTVHERRAPAHRWRYGSAFRLVGDVAKLVVVPLTGVAVLMAAGVWSGHQVASGLGWSTTTRLYSVGMCETAGLVLGCWMGILFVSRWPRFLNWSKRRSMARPAPYWCQWVKGGLNHSDQEYLQRASPRAYLRAVLASPIPHLMEGDREQLSMLLLDTRRQEAEAYRVHAEKVARDERALSGHQRMARFAQALAQESQR